MGAKEQDGKCVRAATVVDLRLHEHIIGTHQGSRQQAPLHPVLAVVAFLCQAVVAIAPPPGFADAARVSSHWHIRTDI